MSNVGPESLTQPLPLTPEAAIAGLGLARAGWESRGWQRTNILPSFDHMTASLFTEVRDGVVEQLEAPGPDDDFRVTTGEALVVVGARPRPKGAPSDFHEQLWETRPCIYVNLSPDGDEDYTSRARHAALTLMKYNWRGTPLSTEATAIIRDFMNDAAPEINLNDVDLERPIPVEPPEFDPGAVARPQRAPRPDRPQPEALPNHNLNWKRYTVIGAGIWAAQRILRSK